MLVEIVELEVSTPPCSARTPGAEGAERFTATVYLSGDIRDVLPYLKAILPRAAYRPDFHFLTWRHSNYDVALHPYRIAIGNLEDREAAVRVADEVVALINDTRTRRAEIIPSYEMPRRPTVMSVYRLLPGGNCRQCGQPTCWSFALKIVAGQAIPTGCPPLAAPAYAVALAQLRALIGP